MKALSSPQLLFEDFTDNFSAILSEEQIAVRLDNLLDDTQESAKLLLDIRSLIELILRVFKLRKSLLVELDQALKTDADLGDALARKFLLLYEGLEDLNHFKLKLT